MNDFLFIGTRIRHSRGINVDVDVDVDIELYYTF